MIFPRMANSPPMTMNVVRRRRALKHCQFNRQNNRRIENEKAPPPNTILTKKTRRVWRRQCFPIHVVYWLFLLINRQRAPHENIGMLRYLSAPSPVMTMRRNEMQRGRTYCVIESACSSPSWRSRGWNLGTQQTWRDEGEEDQPMPQASTRSKPPNFTPHLSLSFSTDALKNFKGENKRSLLTVVIATANIPVQVSTCSRTWIRRWQKQPCWRMWS